MVKKTVKVVKKIVKKVSKRITKGVPDSRVDELGVPEANNDGTVLNSISNTNSLSNSVDAGVKKQEDVKPCGAVLSSDENSSPDVSVSMEVEKLPQKGGICEQNVEKADEVEDGGNVTKLEDEMGMGEGMYYSGELEAVERRKRRLREIFVGGLDKDAEEEDIRKVFEEVGELLEVRLVMNGNTGKNKGYAFLCYASALDAKKALEKFSKVEICGKECGALPLEGKDTIYLGRIDKKWKDDDVAKLLQEMGIEGVDNVLVMKDPEKMEFNRGFAFVEFETCRDAQVAFKKLQKKDAFGKNSKVKAGWAEPVKVPNEAEMQKVKTVYAEFIPSSWDEEKVKENFEKFGEIDNVVLAKNLQNAKRKNYAFISYKSREDAIKCIESFNRQCQNDEGTKVNVKVSLARPMSRGKQPKQVLKPVNKEIPKERPKSSQGSVVLRQIDPRNMGGPTIHHYDIHRPELRQNIVHKEEKSSTTSELVQLLREQASWRPPHAGPLNVGYPTTFSGRKRPVSALDTDPLYSNINGYPHHRVQTTLPSSSRLSASSSYGAFTQGGTPSLAYYPGQAGYAPGLPYGGARSYSGSELRDRAHGSSASNSALYRRY